MSTKLTDTQMIILKNAAERADGSIEPLPENINAGIKPRVIGGLLNRGLIVKVNDKYLINSQGMEAIGLLMPPKPASRPMPREGTKQASMIALMMRPEGASVDEMCQETGWHKHTVRGVISNVVKKQLGLEVTSHKDEGQPRRYRVASELPHKSDNPLD